MPAVAEKEYTSIRVDRDTRDRLKGLAGKRTIAGYLRQISIDLIGDPESAIEKKVTTLVEQVTSLRNIMVSTMMRKNSKGEYVPVVPMDEPDGTHIPLFQSAMIQDEIENNPDVKEAAWYRKNEDGKWEFMQKEFDAWYEQHMKDQDALFAAYEYLDKRGNRANSMSRDELIEYGRKLLDKQKKGRK